MSDKLMASYQQLPVAFDKGEGVWLTDQNNVRYLDALSGLAVCGLGHAHPELKRVISDQAGLLLHTSNLYQIPLQQQLADKLTSLASMDKVFFCNSGAEANEAALKIARLYARKKNISDPVILVAEKSFHGRTLATLSATGNTKIHAGFEPLVPGFMHVPYNNVEVLKQAVTKDENIVAIMLEPILGEGGIVVPDEGYLKNVREICDQNDLLLILDEIQTGLCRTGKWFAHQHEGILPDVMTLAKSLANGVPIGACLARGEAAELIQPGSHGSTFGGNPLAARTALAVLDILANEKLMERAAKLGSEMLAGFKQSLIDIKGVTSIRGKGLMIGIELDRECSELVKNALAEKLLINVTAGNVIRLLPPLIINDDEAKQIVETVTKLVKNFLGQGSI